MNDLAEVFRAQLENQFLTGGVTLVAFTALLAALRNVPRLAMRALRRHFVTTVDISDHDAAFFWVQSWLGEHEYTRTRARVLTASTRTLAAKGAPVEEISNPRMQQLTEVVFSPAPGLHLLRFRGHFILIRRERTRGEGTLGELAYHESLELHALSRDIVRDLIHEARAAAFPPEDSRIAVLRPVYGSQWKIAQRRLPRAIESVVLDEGVAESAIADLTWFLGASRWYAEHGIPYQRGYLLSGPPGNGKTSLVAAIASAFGRDIYILNLSTTNDHQLSMLMGELPEHAIVLIEDIDRAFRARERTSDTSDRLTFSGFINAIDGITAPPGRVLFMTTNHPEHLDAALLRPGRADRKFELRNATPSMARRLFLRFFESKPGLADEFARAVAVSGRERSMAELQEILIAHQGDGASAVERLRAGMPPNGASARGAVS